MAKEHEERRATYVPEGEAKKPEKGPGENGWRWRVATALVVAVIVAVAWWLCR